MGLRWIKSKTICSYLGRQATHEEQSQKGNPGSSEQVEFSLLEPLVFA